MVIFIPNYFLFVGSNGQNAPVFVIDPQSTTVKLGDNVSLKCKTVPPTEVLWMYDNLPIVSNTSYEIRPDDVSGRRQAEEIKCAYFWWSHFQLSLMVF